MATIVPLSEAERSSLEKQMRGQSAQSLNNVDAILGGARAARQDMDAQRQARATAMNVVSGTGFASAPDTTEMPFDSPRANTPDTTEMPFDTPRANTPDTTEMLFDTPRANTPDTTDMPFDTARANTPDTTDMPFDTPRADTPDTTPMPFETSSNPPADLRIMLKPLHADDFFQPGIMDPISSLLKNTTGGILFPYTPNIQFSQAVNYMDLQLVHSNTDYPAYTRTPSVSISISGKFTVQSQQEGRYALACLHFLRTASKCYFGELDTERAGLPPPILVLSGYGNYVFNQLRVILKTHSWTFDDSADGVVIKLPKGVARLPALFTVTCELMVVQTPQRMRQTFSFNKFSSGELMEATNLGWI